MFSLVLEIDEDSSELSTAFLMWLAVVGLLWFLSTRVQRRDEAARRMIAQEAQPQVDQVRQVLRQRPGAARVDGASGSASGSGQEGPSAASSQPASNAPAAPGGPREREDCPICLDKVTWPVDTNCSHCFCAQCFLSYHDQQGGLISRNMVKCPCCRRGVDVILPSEPGWTDAEKDSEQGKKLKEKVNEYNERYSSAPRSWNNIARDTPHYLRRLWTEISSGNVSGFQLLQQARIWLIVLGTLLYFLSPFDLIPEGFFGLIGLLDDIFVVVCGMMMVGGIFRGIQIQNVHAH